MELLGTLPPRSDHRARGKFSLPLGVSACYIIAGFTALAAILELLLYHLLQTSVIPQGRSPGILPFFLVVILFNSVRASFAFHQIRNPTNPLPPPYFV